MRIIRNASGISRLVLILLLLVSAIVGAVLSYMWTMGYYASLGLHVPEAPTVTITNATFDPQEPTYFNVTILNPSFSPSDANITQIAVLTEDNVFYDVTEVDPPLSYSSPYQLQRSKSETFRCLWDWADHTGKTVKIIAFIANGSGPTLEAETPLVDLKIIDVRFNPTISITHFNMSVQNSPLSVTYVNITEVTIDKELISPENLSIPLPYTLDLNESVSFTCMWNWTDYQDKDVTVAVHTSQGYAAYYTYSTLKPVILTITDVLFNVTDTTHFNMTVHNSADSPTYVNITRITVTVENETFPDIPVVPPPDLPYSLDVGANVTFRCSWNWTDHRGENVAITVHTLQDFTKSVTQTTTARVILTITNVIFDVTDPSYFNVTVRNSELSVEDYVNITIVTVTVENGTPEEITIEPPIMLYANKSVTFTCIWNWTNYWNKTISIIVHADGYSAYGTKVTPSPVIISGVLFNLSDTTHFNITIKNSEFFSTYILITNITATLEDGTVQDVTVVSPTCLPYVLHPDEWVILNCSWGWTKYCDQNITLIVNTLRGYIASYTERTPLPIIIEVTNVLFNITDTTHFNVTVRNSEFSLEDANITRITLTMDNETILEITEVIPYLPRMLSPNSSSPFMCSWNWTNYRDTNVTITVHTLEGYEASSTYKTPPL